MADSGSVPATSATATTPLVAETTERQVSGSEQPAAATVPAGTGGSDTAPAPVTAYGTVSELVEITNCTQQAALEALKACEYDLTRACNKIFAAREEASQVLRQRGAPAQAPVATFVPAMGTGGLPNLAGTGVTAPLLAPTTATALGTTYSVQPQRPQHESNPVAAFVLGSGVGCLSGIVVGLCATLF
ncbi:unnamed protein product [Symbiodinium necroappetens]|uniref:UBA domain-containing protein n=1 Tax=Symbiodinium necroappetens TaxID=1628268 RepID=A0A813ALK9_9DINO|nr:unnamed protein product [Symbiodinium necroappetens]